MDDARIAALLAPFLNDGAPGRRDEEVALSRAQLDAISMYIDLLLRWNARINLTAVREPEEIVARHFGESIFAARHLFPGKETSAEPLSAADTPHVIDVGSGAGFPGLPIKVWAPEVRLTLIESNQKKATFLREAVRSLMLAGVDIFSGRAEAFSEPTGDVVTLRAVERFESILPTAAGLLGPRGRLAILIGSSQLRALRELVPGLRWGDPEALPMSANRVLIIGKHEP